MKALVLSLWAVSVGSSAESAEEPLLPSLEWQASAAGVALRVSELVEFGKAYGTDDIRLAEAVAGLKERSATRKEAPLWTSKSGWVEGKGKNQVFFGVGVFRGAISNRYLAFSVAENRARVEIAKLLKVPVVRKSEANGWRTVTVTSTANLANVVIVDWYAQGPVFYALAAYAEPIALASDAPWIP